MTEEFTKNAHSYAICQLHPYAIICQPHPYAIICQPHPYAIICQPHPYAIICQPCQTSKRLLRCSVLQN